MASPPSTAEPWSKHYKMYSYVTRELPALIEANFPVDGARMGIFGHSMGGLMPVQHPERVNELLKEHFASGSGRAARRGDLNGAPGAAVFEGRAEQ